MVAVTRRTRGDGPDGPPHEAGSGPTAPPDPAAVLEQRKGAAKAEYDRHVREVESKEDALGVATSRHTEADGVYQAAVDAYTTALTKVHNMRETYKVRYNDPNARAAKDYKRKLDGENAGMKALVQKKNDAFHDRATLSGEKKTKAGELARAKIALKAAKGAYEAFFGKSGSAETCPACDHNYTVRNGAHTIGGVANVAQFSCLCFKYANNCLQCPVCSINMDPNAPISLESTSACTCVICKYVTPLFPSRGDGDGGGDGEISNLV